MIPEGIEKSLDTWDLNAVDTVKIDSQTIGYVARHVVIINVDGVTPVEIFATYSLDDAIWVHNYLVTRKNEKFKKLMEQQSNDL